MFWVRISKNTHVYGEVFTQKTLSLSIFVNEDYYKYKQIKINNLTLWWLQDWIFCLRL